MQFIKTIPVPCVYTLDATGGVAGAAFKDCTSLLCSLVDALQNTHSSPVLKPFQQFQHFQPLHMHDDCDVSTTCSGRFVRRGKLVPPPLFSLTTKQGIYIECLFYLVTVGAHVWMMFEGGLVTGDVFAKRCRIVNTSCYEPSLNTPNTHTQMGVQVECPLFSFSLFLSK